MRSAAVVVAVATLGLGGCSANGVLLVRGVVRAERPAGAEPLAGATVQSRDGRDGARRYSRVTTREDGTYAIDHRYAATWFPLLKPKGGDAYVEFSAPGYQPRLVQVRGGTERGVVRGESGPYTRLDVTLVPEAKGPPAKAR